MPIMAPPENEVMMVPCFFRLVKETGLQAICPRPPVRDPQLPMGALPVVHTLSPALWADQPLFFPALALLLPTFPLLLVLSQGHVR
jgi:hypothetical protein